MAQEYIEQLNAFIAKSSKNLADIAGTQAFGNFPIPVGTHYEFFASCYVQRKAELIIKQRSCKEQMITDSSIVNMFMNRKVLTDLGSFSSSLVHLLQDADIREFILLHEFHRRDPNSAFCADLMSAFEGSSPHVHSSIEKECESLASIGGWFHILPIRQQRQCLLKALAGSLWLQAHSVCSTPCTQAQLERALLISKFLSNTSGLEPTTYIEWLKG